MAPYRVHYHDVRWTRPESWHLTLLFLGAADPARVPELETLIVDVARAHAPYRARVDLGGGRVRRGEGVAWLALSEGAGALIDAATDVALRVPPDITEGPPPKRTPSAHLTLARQASELAIDALSEQRHGPLSDEWIVGRIQLVRSHLEPDGARYQTLHESTL